MSFIFLEDFFLFPSLYLHCYIIFYLSALFFDCEKGALSLISIFLFFFILQVLSLPSVTAPNMHLHSILLTQLETLSF